jgi:hypothetical protein
MSVSGIQDQISKQGLRGTRSDGNKLPIMAHFKSAKEFDFQLFAQA